MSAPSLATLREQWLAQLKASVREQADAMDLMDRSEVQQHLLRLVLNVVPKKSDPVWERIGGLEHGLPPTLSGLEDMALKEWKRIRPTPDTYIHRWIAELRDKICRDAAALTLMSDEGRRLHLVRLVFDTAPGEDDSFVWKRFGGVHIGRPPRHRDAREYRIRRMGALAVANQDRRRISSHNEWNQTSDECGILYARG